MDDRVCEKSALAKNRLEEKKIRVRHETELMDDAVT